MVDYQQTITLVDKFMGESGIKDFCQNICRGACCHHCPDNNAGCQHLGISRLGCLLHLCMELMILIFSDEEFSLWKELCTQTKWQLVCSGIDDIYFTRYPLIAIKRFEINEEHLDILGQFQPESIAEKLDKVKAALESNYFKDFTSRQAKQLILLDLKIRQRAFNLLL